MSAENVTLEEICNEWLDEPLEKLIITIDFLRYSIGKGVSFEGCISSLDVWVKHYGEVSEENVKKWFTDLGDVMKVEIPLSAINEILNQATE